MRILCVDDDPLVRRVYAAVLGDAGHDVQLAASVDEAVAVLECERFDVLIADYRLGYGPRGTILLNMAIERWPHMRRFLVTGTQPSPDQALLWTKLAEQVLPKPWTPSQLLALLDPPLRKP